ACLPTVFYRRLLISLVCLCALLLFFGPEGRFLVVLPLLLFGPGYLIARWLPVAGLPRLSGVYPTLWLGLSLSAIPLFYLWAWVTGLALTTPVLWVLVAALGLALTVAVWRSAEGDIRQGRSIDWLPLAAVLGLTLATRASQIADLALPPWVDSLH